MANKVFVFFNCNENKTESSMNIFYNNVTFKDTIISRRRLLNKVQSECRAGNIQIAAENLPEVEEIILHGDPEDAGKFITYGTIKAFKCL